MGQFLVLYLARWNSDSNYNVVYCIRSSRYLANSIDISIEITQNTHNSLLHRNYKIKEKLDNNTFKSLRNISRLSYLFI